ncbi:hypothetical protein JCM10908_003721 [Rhodotorula pacifica]|uniref:uncharacterized protein n=1 Tax=Rhodotorula pacifica TaxID=1495444 RepID=UPI00317CD166
MLHDGTELDLYPSVWSILVRPGTTIIVKASTGLGSALSGRSTPRSISTPYEQPAGSDPCTIAQRLEALAELGTDDSLRHYSPRASRHARHGQVSSAPESPLLESSQYYPSPPSSRPRSLVGPNGRLPSLITQHFDEIGGWSGCDDEQSDGACAAGSADGADEIAPFAQSAKPARPTCQTSLQPASLAVSSMPRRRSPTKAYSAPVSAIERDEHADAPRRIRTDADLRAIAATRPRPRPSLGSSAASFPPAPPLTALAPGRSPSSPHPAHFNRRSSMGVLSTCVPRPEQLRLTSLDTRAFVDRGGEGSSYVAVSTRSSPPIASPAGLAHLSKSMPDDYFRAGSRTRSGSGA